MRTVSFMLHVQKLLVWLSNKKSLSNIDSLLNPAPWLQLLRLLSSVLTHSTLKPGTIYHLKFLVILNQWNLYFKMQSSKEASPSFLGIIDFPSFNGRLFHLALSNRSSKMESMNKWKKRCSQLNSNGFQIIIWKRGHIVLILCS